MEFGLPGGEEDGEDNGVAFVEISKILAMQGAFVSGTEPSTKFIWNVPAYRAGKQSVSDFKMAAKFRYVWPCRGSSNLGYVTVAMVTASVDAWYLPKITARMQHLRHELSIIASCDSEPILHKVDKFENWQGRRPSDTPNRFCLAWWVTFPLTSPSHLEQAGVMKEPLYMANSHQYTITNARLHTAISPCHVMPAIIQDTHRLI